MSLGTNSQQQERLFRRWSEKNTPWLHHQLLLPHHQPQQEQCSAPSQPTRNPWTPKSFGKDFLNATVSSRGANYIG